MLFYIPNGIFGYTFFSLYCEDVFICTLKKLDWQLRLLEDEFFMGPLHFILQLISPYKSTLSALKNGQQISFPSQMDFNLSSQIVILTASDESFPLSTKRANCHHRSNIKSKSTAQLS